jgi:hypothetical protein
LEFISEAMHFIKADNHVGFYELFILWCVQCVAMTWAMTRGRELVTEKQLEVLLYSRCVYEADSGEKVS